jgi:hypothetical protein
MKHIFPLTTQLSSLAFSSPKPQLFTARLHLLSGEFGFPHPLIPRIDSLSAASRAVLVVGDVCRSYLRSLETSVEKKYCRSGDFRWSDVRDE